MLQGKVMATIGGGGTLLRLSIPERHAPNLHHGDLIQIDESGTHQNGTQARLCPVIQNGRVIADVEIAGLADTFVDARLLVRLPMGRLAALMVPVVWISSR